MEIIIKQEITEDHFEDIIVTALEGGSNYWYLINWSEFKNNLLGTNNDPITLRIARTLYHKEDFGMDVYDVEEPEELLGTVTQKTMLDAIVTANKEYPHVYNDLIEGTGDAETGDILFQLATMGEITFG